MLSFTQRGTHNELLAQGGLYKEIYDLQLKDQEQFRKEMMFLEELEGTMVGNGAEMTNEKLQMTNESAESDA